MNFADSYTTYNNLIARLGLDISTLGTHSYDETEFQRLLSVLADFLGMNFVHLMAFHTPYNKKIMAPDFSLSTFPAEWDKGYYEKERWRHDPTYTYIQRQLIRQPVVYGTWSEALEHELIWQATQNNYDAYVEKLTTVFAQASHHQINSGIFIAKRNQAHKLVLYFSSAESDEELMDRFDKKHWETLYTTLLIFEDLLNHLIIKQPAFKKADNTVKTDIFLSETERSLMQYFITNPQNTIKEASCARNVSENTTNFHLKQIRKKLHAPRMSGYNLALILKEKHIL